MAGSKGNYLSNALLNFVLGAVSYSSPVTVYIALFTADTALISGTLTNEVSGGSYARVAVTNNTTNWPTTSSQSKTNGTAFVFPTATGSWGTVTAFAILDASSGGNVLYWGDLTTSKSISSGDTAQFASSSITITEV
jgi:hypothetical protein